MAEKKFEWEEYLAHPSTLGADEFNKAVDEYLAERNKHIGESYRVPLGAYPPAPHCMVVQSNEWVTTDLIRRWCDAVGDYKNPLFRDEEYAKKTIWGGIIAPFQFIDALAPGFVDDTRGRPPGFGTLPGGSRCKFFQILRPGDKIRVIDTYLGVVEKHADTHRAEKGYRLIKDVTRRTFINHREEVVATSDASMMGVLIIPGGPVARSDASPDRPLPKYTREYIDLILHTYEAEKPRGAEKRYWEDVVEGEEMTPTVFGPLSTVECAMFMSIVGYTESLAFAGWWHRQKAYVAGGATINKTYPLDEKTGAPVRLVPHLQRDSLVSGKVSHVIGYGNHTWGIMSHHLTNWMGDEAVCKIFSNQMRREIFLDETAWCKGKVARKYVEGDEHLVDLEMHLENQEGFVILPAQATVRLPTQNA